MNTFLTWLWLILSSLGVDVGDQPGAHHPGHRVTCADQSSSQDGLPGRKISNGF